jgi:hypothetical protein
MQIDDNKHYDSISATLLHATEVGNVLAKWIETAEPTYCASLRNTQLSAILLFLSKILNLGGPLRKHKKYLRVCVCVCVCARAHVCVCSCQCAHFLLFLINVVDIDLNSRHFNSLILFLRIC